MRVSNDKICYLANEEGREIGKGGTLCKFMKFGFQETVSYGRGGGGQKKKEKSQRGKEGKEKKKKTKKKRKKKEDSPSSEKVYSFSQGRNKKKVLS